MIKVTRNIIPKRFRRKKRKTVKKNTLRRKLKATSIKINRRQQQRTTAVIKIDETQRTCANCGEVYQGRICPQCGQAGTWMRYSWRQALLNLLDIWGLGNRPMFRTLQELFWQPGYMIRDYLNGHRNFYFPPFKLLALTVVFLLFVLWLTGKNDIIPGELLKGDILFQKLHLSGFKRTLAEAVFALLRFLIDNLLYMLLFVSAYFGLCIWLAFRRVGKRNFVETYVFLIFVVSQLLICFGVICLLNASCAAGQQMSLKMAASGNAIWSTAAWIMSALVTIVSLASSALSLMGCFLLWLDFKQFYGLKGATLINHLLKTVTLLVLIFIWVAILVYEVATVKTEPYNLVWILSLILVPVAFFIADKRFSQSVNQVPTAVRRVSKLLMLSVFGVFAIENKESGLPVALCCVQVAVYIALATTLSLLPVLLYKRLKIVFINVRRRIINTITKIMK